jgi:hypothetical protein
LHRLDLAASGLTSLDVIAALHLARRADFLAAVRRFTLRETGFLLFRLTIAASGSLQSERPILPPRKRATELA